VGHGAVTQGEALSSDVEICFCNLRKHYLANGICYKIPGAANNSEMHYFPDLPENLHDILLALDSSAENILRAVNCINPREIQEELGKKLFSYGFTNQFLRDYVEAAPVLLGCLKSNEKINNGSLKCWYSILAGCVNLALHWAKECLEHFD
jgi:hypothetical protein